MGLSEDGEDVVESQFEELCLDLNMDKKAKDEAFENYQKILENYSLEACFNRNLLSISKFGTHPYDFTPYKNHVIHFFTLLRACVT